MVKKRKKRSMLEYKAEILWLAHERKQKGFNIYPKLLVNELHKKGFRTKNEVYAALKDLEKKGLLLGEQVDPLTGNGRYKLYTLTNAGNSLSLLVQDFRESKQELELVKEKHKKHKETLKYLT